MLFQASICRLWEKEGETLRIALVASHLPLITGCWVAGFGKECGKGNWRDGEVFVRMVRIMERMVLAKGRDLLLLRFLLFGRGDWRDLF